MTTSTWETITDAMAQTMINGTASAMHLEGIDFAGKTGTAQVVSHNFGDKSVGSGALKANAWFVGMAPRRNPDIVVAVLCEHGGWGAEASAPVAAQIINAFVTKQRKRAGNLRIETVAAPVTHPQSSSAAPTANAAPVTNNLQRPTKHEAYSTQPAKPVSIASNSRPSEPAH